MSVSGTPFSLRQGAATRAVALLFLRLGVIGFGGPAAHIAMMEEEVVKRRKWLTPERFLDLLGATNLIPGPNSTEMAIHIGYVKAGWPGLMIAGVCFILPAAAITLCLASLYVSFQTVPQLAPFMFGIRSGVLAVILAAVFRLGTAMFKKPFFTVLGLTVTILALFHYDEITLLLGAGLCGMAWQHRDRLRQYLTSALAACAAPLLTGLFAAPGDESGMPATLTGLAAFFLKIGAILYGSGYVLVAFLQSGLVEQHHWLTQQQLLDAIAIGQFTPGPLLSTATFIGYVLLGLPGAAVATGAIFLPSFIFVALSSPFIPRLRSSALARGFLDGVNSGALGLMLAVCIALGAHSLINPAGWIIFALAAAALTIWKLNAAWIVLGSAGLGWLFSLLSQ